MERVWLGQSEWGREDWTSTHIADISAPPQSHPRRPILPTHAYPLYSHPIHNVHGCRMGPVADLVEVVDVSRVATFELLAVRD